MTGTHPKIEGDGTHRRRKSTDATGIIARVHAVHALDRVDKLDDPCREAG